MILCPDIIRIPKFDEICRVNVEPKFFDSKQVVAPRTIVESQNMKNSRDRQIDAMHRICTYILTQNKIRGKAMTPWWLVTAWNQFLIGRTRSVSRVPRVLRCRIT